jgi:hypothetical protein
MPLHMRVDNNCREKLAGYVKKFEKLKETDAFNIMFSL